MRLTKDQIKKIKELYKKKEKIKDIAKRFKVSSETICYHVNEKYNKEHKKQALSNFMKKWKKKSLKERQLVYKQRVPYMRDYMREYMREKRKSKSIP